MSNENFLDTLRNGVVFYGAGNTGFQLKSLFLEQGIPVRLFIDKNQSNPDSVPPILNPKFVNADMVKYPVIIAVHNYQVDMRPVMELLQTIGWKKENIYTLSRLYYEVRKQKIFLPLPPLYWLSLESSKAEQANIDLVYSFLEDEKSREIFSAELKLRNTGEYSEILFELDQDCYYPDFLHGLNHLHFVDGGTFDGDTLKAFLDQKITFDSIYCFEPDSQNLKALMVRLKDMNLTCPISVYPIGLCDSFSQQHFCEGKETGSCIQESGGITIQCGALDDILHNHEISYVKMDIEGSEIHAIQGAAKTIQKYQPIMAISVYHRPNHLWRIPLLLKELVPDYKIYMRLYTYNCFETFCYAVPSSFTQK